MFAGTWLVAITLFSMRLSGLLEQDINQGFIFLGMSLTFFLIGYTLTFFLRKRISLGIHSREYISDYILKRFNSYFIFWILATIAEILYSRGIPIVWLLTGSEKTYFDFGIPSLHGLLNALQLSLGVIAFYLYLITKKKKYIYITLLFVLYNVAIISRQVIIVLLIEIFVIYFYLATNKLKLFRTLIIYFVLAIVGFGILGDLRSDAKTFLVLAQPTERWPDWLPSGFLWVYIYITTPINNLIYNFSFPVEQYRYFFPNTLSLLLPSVIRNMVFSPEDYNVSGNLISLAFNVSSAFAAPYADMGFTGIKLFSLFIGVFSNLTWWAEGSKRIFFRAVISQAILLSIFYNHFMYLPVAFQFFWIYLFFVRIKYVKKSV